MPHIDLGRWADAAPVVAQSLFTAHFLSQSSPYHPRIPCRTLAECTANVASFRAATAASGVVSYPVLASSRRIVLDALRNTTLYESVRRRPLPVVDALVPLLNVLLSPDVHYARNACGTAHSIGIVASRRLPAHQWLPCLSGNLSRISVHDYRLLKRNGLHISVVQYDITNSAVRISPSLKPQSAPAAVQASARSARVTRRARGELAAPPPMHNGLSPLCKLSSSSDSDADSEYSDVPSDVNSDDSLPSRPAGSRRYRPRHFCVLTGPLAMINCSLGLQPINAVPHKYDHARLTSEWRTCTVHDAPIARGSQLFISYGDRYEHRLLAVLGGSAHIVPASELLRI